MLMRPKHSIKTEAAFGDNNRLAKAKMTRI